MFSFLPTLILRHRKENILKCSLRGLESRPDMRFFTYPYTPLPSLEGYILLSLEGDAILSVAEKEYGIFLIDGTWRHVETMLRMVIRPPSLV